LVVDVELDVEFEVGVGEAVAPGVSICPANTGRTSVRLRIVMALSWRKVFIFWVPPREMKKFFINLVECDFSCKSLRDCVRFAGSLFPCIKCEK
jgi:hypothetical protein